MIPQSGPNVFEEIPSISPALTSYGCPMPGTNGFGKGAGIDNTHLLLCGGLQMESNICQIHIIGSSGFDSHPTNLLSPRMDHAVSTVGGKLWISGGVSSGSGIIFIKHSFSVVKYPFAL